MDANDICSSLSNAARGADEILLALQSQLSGLQSEQLELLGLIKEDKKRSVRLKVVESQIRQLPREMKPQQDLADYMWRLASYWANIIKEAV